MNKSAQSLLDLFNLLSGEKSFAVFKSPVNNKEAQALYKLWQSGERDEYGRIVVPLDDRNILRSLAEKNLVRSLDMRLANKFQSPLVEITDEGQKIIRDIILYAEKSSYEGGIENLDYEDIYKTIRFGPGVKKAKVACKMADSDTNWLHKACR